FNFPYGKTKKAGEEEVKRFVREKGLPAVIVNPTSAIGEQDFAPTPIGKPIADIARGLWPVYVSGGACFIDVHDVVRGLWLARDSPPRFKGPRPVLPVVAAVGEWAADPVTRKDPPLTRAMAGLVGKYLFFDGNRARTELGFEAGPVAPAIARCIQWFREAR